jgi:hypothetical protein
MPRTALLLATLAILLAPLAQAVERGYTLRLDKAGWGNGSVTDIGKILHSACDALDKHLPAKTLKEPIRVRRGNDGPITLFRRSVRGEIIVQLDTGDRFWCQYAYQMAHEYCHVMCRFREGGRDNLWFEESLCELASLYVMRSMAESWKIHPPYTNWKGYSKSISDYISDVEAKYPLPDGQNMAKFYAEHADEFKAKPTNRDHNGRVAVALLPLFEKSPAQWLAVTYLNAGRGKDNLPFAEHLKNWHDSCPEKHRAFVKNIAKQFGIKI